MGEGSFEEADRGKMDGGWDLGAIAREILDANLYMTLGTADGDGRPWVSPVWYAAEGYARFYWVSSPEARHSRNIATRPQVSIVVFDSTAPEGMGQAVYVSATAEELTGSELDGASASSLARPGEVARANGDRTTCARRPPTGCTGRPPRNTGCSTRTGIRSTAAACGTAGCRWPGGIWW